jgi:hypothetical protein
MSFVTVEEGRYHYPGLYFVEPSNYQKAPLSQVLHMLKCCTWLEGLFQKDNSQYTIQKVIDHPFTEWNISIWMCASAITWTTPLCLCFTDVSVTASCTCFCYFFQDGDVFMAFLSVQLHVFTLWISLMPVTNTSKCLFIILLCRHHWNCHCSCSLLLTFIKTPLNFTHANYKYCYAKKSNNRASLKLTTVTESII